MPDFFEENPLTQVHDTLWSMLEAHPNVDQVVRIGNRIKFNQADNRDPLKSKIQDADVPELSLISDGGLANMNATSSTSSLTRRFAWMISTGDQRITSYLYQVEWVVFVAMHDWKQRLTALQYNGNSFVKRARILSITEGMSDGSRNRNLKGWSSLWRCELEMHFKISDLVAELTP